MLRTLTSDQNAARKIVLLGLLVSILPFVILTFFTHPAYDDYSWVVLVKQHGYLPTQKLLYDTFIGRYFSTSLITFTPLNFGSFAGYKAVTLGTVVLTFVSIYCFVAALLKTSATRLEKLIAASFFTALFANQTPDVTEAWFWVTGNLVYQLGGILTLFFFALVIKSSGRRGRFGPLMLGCVMIAAIVGTNETSMLALGILILSITMKSFIAKNDQRISWLIFSLVTLICAVIVIVAPGNAVRASETTAWPHQHLYIYALGMSVAQEVRFMSIWLSNSSFVLGTIIFIPIASQFASRIEVMEHLRIHPTISSAILLLIVFCGFFGPYWGMGTLGQHRTVNTVYFLFIIGWFVNLMIWIDYFQRKHRVRLDRLPNYVYLIGIPLLVLNLLLMNNTRTAIIDLASLRAYRYDLAMEQRYSRFAQCAQQGRIQECSRPVIPDLPSTITNPYFEDDYSSEREFWNYQVAAQSK